MPAASEFVAYLVETLKPLGGVGARRMFGGHGIFKDGLMLGLVAADQLYLKVDDGNRGAYEAKGLKPFDYVKRGKRVAMSYYEAPSEAFDDPDVLCDWAQDAYGAARRAKKPKRA
jgi:DNA transformation protein